MAFNRLAQHEPGSLIRAFTVADVETQIENTTVAIKAAARSGDIDRAMTLISKRMGLRMVLKVWKR